LTLIACQEREKKLASKAEDALVQARRVNSRTPFANHLDSPPFQPLQCLVVLTCISQQEKLETDSMRVYITELSGKLSAQKKTAEAELGKSEQNYRSKVENLEQELAELTLASETRVKSLTAHIEELTKEQGEVSVDVCRSSAA
jgi:hypothetical protein